MYLLGGPLLFYKLDGVTYLLMNKTAKLSELIGGKIH
mgnify:CR=1 FL=1